MKCLFSVLLLYCMFLAGCGAVFVRASFNAGAAGTITTSGTVSIVHLTFANDGKGNSVTVTVVTLLQQAGAQDLTFCGSQVGLFPMNMFVTVNYTPGSTCASLNTVSVSH